MTAKTVSLRLYVDGMFATSSSSIYDTHANNVATSRRGETTGMFDILVGTTEIKYINSTTGLSTYVDIRGYTLER